MEDKDIKKEVMSEDNVLEGEGIAKEPALDERTDAKPSENTLAETQEKNI